MEALRKLEDLMHQDFPEQTYIVDRLIPDSSITIFSGHSRSFKTYTLLHAALSIASGEPLFGQFPTQQAAVLIIDEENGQRLLQKRLRQLGAAVDLPIYFTPHMGFGLSNSNIDNLLLSCQEHGIRLIIIDSLIRIHDSDENSAREMAKVFRKLRRFTENQIAVLVTQHNRKQGNVHAGTSNEMRGSSDILAAVDSHIGVVRKEKWYLTFDQTKQRYDVELDPFEVRVVADEESFRFEYLGGAKPRLDKAEVLRKAVQNLLVEHEQLSQKELLEKLAEAEVGTNEHALRASLARWIAEGYILPPTRGNGSTKLYRLNGDLA